jgi:hypothetical protein
MGLSSQRAMTWSRGRMMWWAVVCRTRSDWTMSLLMSASPGWVWRAWEKTYSSSSALKAWSPSVAGPRPAQRRKRLARPLSDQMKGKNR